MILVLASFRIPAEHIARARDLIPAVVAETRAEDGCIAYDVAEDVLSPGLFRVSERWASEAALKAHLAAAHMAAWGAARAEMGMTERAVTVFDIASAKDL
ncbi:antibiotic biosynthesis monooxygenase [Novosphingobium sp. FSY-8]|uniref:Antibiotic biosynthesis monooxygenase n=1 Tax=Novosphingobium ovatum TaxID=1908523 RepID=A0ABW9XBE5_9SPHN|nr:putative quinol monooxygenase [Novosphingobium ovatum]NBC35844.1 antibiotic biosynthesis monooxygenase [Novosphingobium ovatum]